MPETANHQCLHCSLVVLCVPDAPNSWLLTRFGQAMQKRTQLPDHRMLCWQDEAQEELFIVRRGTLKAVVTDINGKEQVRGFYVAGELAGLDALHRGVWQSSLEVLGEADICQISRDDLRTLMHSDAQIGARLLDIMSQHLALSLTWNGDYTASQRLAAFLLNLFHRCPPLPAGTPAQVHLDMSRQDLARHLRLVTETVSRELTKMRKSGLISVHRRQVLLTDLQGLVKAAGPLRHLAATGSHSHQL